jgi:hypothetical protein
VVNQCEETLTDVNTGFCYMPCSIISLQNAMAGSTQCESVKERRRGWKGLEEGQIDEGNSGGESTAVENEGRRWRTEDCGGGRTTVVADGRRWWRTDDGGAGRMTVVQDGNGVGVWTSGLEDGTRMCRTDDGAEGRTTGLEDGRRR